MDYQQQYQMQPQSTGAAPGYYAPPIEKTPSMNAVQQGGNYGAYQAVQNQPQPENAYGAPGSNYLPADAVYAPTNGVYEGQNAGYGDPPAGSPRLTFGMKRVVFFSVISAAIVLVALVIGLGAGLGVSQNKLHTAQNDLADAQSSLSALANAASPTASPTTNPSSTSSAPTALPTSNIDCPKSNNTMFTASNGEKFEQFCGVDYSGEGAADLSSTKAISMDACMEACATKKGCQGAGWGYLAGDKSLNHTCYMKTNLTKSHSADATWAFGKLLTSS